MIFKVPSLVLLLALSLDISESNNEVSFNDLNKEEAVKDTLHVKTLLQDSLNHVAEDYYNLAIENFKINELGNSFQNAGKMYEIAQKNGNQLQQIKSLKLLSLIYEKKGDLEKALACLKQANTLKDTYFLETGDSSFLGNNFPIIENKILQLEKVNSKQEKTLKFNQLAIILSVLLIVILSLFTLSLYKNNQIRAGANKLLQKKNEELFAAKEKAEQASKIKENFLSTISHELRTPIYAVTGLTYLLLQENPNKSQEEHLNSLKYSGEHLLSLINNILDLNKLSAKKVKKINTDFNLRLKMADFYQSFVKTAKDKSVEVHMLIEDQIPEVLNGDILKVFQVLINLVSNAIKFTNNGDVWIRLSLVNEEKKQVMLRFEIEDNGIGIDKKHQKSIFKNFNQGQDETNIRYGGTGLGLPIVKNLLLFLGSKIHLESEKGKGAKFYFDISFGKAQQGKGVVKQLDKNEQDFLELDMLKVLEGKRILIVDDNKLNQKITEKILLRKNTICDVAGNGQLALDFVHKHIYDLILMDIDMPVMDGIEATEIIRKKDSRTPIIALTAVSLEGKIEQFLNHGFTDVIPKPYKTELFYEKIYKVLKLAQRSA
ncbi:ATP-binding protein [Mesonia ostreae]|uniref:histidine kinase n=1 Tax=Mesonia ostreae TaxID=861110 RepID=A0ABU2KKY1_9FLAO|nr:ATP-binding protein [Mesonia ostreae]MDT0295387.1 ATP-binding protein [Mesonia ostreae]